MKKINILGKEVSILLIVVALLAVSVTATVVGYLSNTKTVTVTTASPLKMKFTNGSYSDTAVLALGTIFGGENIFYSVTTKNYANVNVPSFPITEIVSNFALTGSEVITITLADPTYPAGINVTNNIYYVRDDGALSKFILGVSGVAVPTRLKLFLDNNGDGIAQKYDRPPGFEEWNNITITTAAGITPGMTLAIYSCQLNDIMAYCP